eukprot:TRINITY_DN56765_c0_g1_i1.p1 TRINITY_DN56765_c0_g1~~TRINITY_DN56765_c0_g1_i1.p1  ORF type:complete len:272 (+),score=-3.27 TRINITY_DN56765_c0_g1_i1:42-857(+)
MAHLPVDVLCIIAEFANEDSLRHMSHSCSLWFSVLPVVAPLIKSYRSLSLCLSYLQQNPDYAAKVRALGFRHIMEKTNMKKLVACVIQRPTLLRTLDLRDNGISGQGVMYIAHAIQKNPDTQLQVLDLRGNSVGVRGFVALSEVVRIPHCKLNFLALSHLHSCDKGVQELAVAIAGPNCSLRTLMLKLPISTDGLNYLASGLEASTCKLKTLDLSGCWLHLGCPQMESLSLEGRVRIKTPVSVPVPFTYTLSGAHKTPASRRWRRPCRRGP